MVEKVTDSTAQESTTTGAAFTSEKVKKCPSCDTVNPGSATKCSGCGDALHNAAVDTVPATCPHCAGERPFVPAGTSTPYKDEDGTTKWTAQSDEGYHGECPHCHQTEYSANAAKKALEKGQFPEWGQNSSKFYP